MAEGVRQPFASECVEPLCRVEAVPNLSRLCGWSVVHNQPKENVMHVYRGSLGNAMRIVLWSGMAIGLWGINNPLWSATDSSDPTSQNQPAGATESAPRPGKGPDAKGSGDHPVRKACAEDVKRLCPGVQAGGGRIVQCLKEHQQELSQSCSEMMQQRGRRRQ